MAVVVVTAAVVVVADRAAAVVDTAAPPTAADIPVAASMEDMAAATRDEAAVMVAAEDRHTAVAAVLDTEADRPWRGVAARDERGPETLIVLITRRPDGTRSATAAAIARPAPEREWRASTRLPRA